MRHCFRPAVLLVAVAALAACGERPESPPAPRAAAPATPPDPLTPPSAPDTTTMGAGPATGPYGASCGIQALPEEVLRRINAARAAARSCGVQGMGPARPLKWDPALSSAAAAHAADMARRNYFDHQSPEGRSVSHRASASGYKWKSVGENIAGGDMTVDEVMQEWLNSPDHCTNVMEPVFTDVAVACVQQPGTQWGAYWTMVLGRKR